MASKIGFQYRCNGEVSMLRLVIIVFGLLFATALAWSQLIGQGVGPVPIQAPVISNATPTILLPVTSEGAVNTMMASNSPTSWSLSSCSLSCTNYFALNTSTGAVTGGSAAASITAGTYTLTMTAFNGATSASGTDTITVSTTPAGYYVSTTGSDSNNGTSPSTAFATLGKAQTAMQGGSIKTTYLEPGTYTLTASYTLMYVTLTSADNGETWSGDPGYPWSSAVINASGDFGNVFFINGGSNITITNMTLKNFVYHGVGIHGGAAAGYAHSFNFNTGLASGNTVSNLECDNVIGTYDGPGSLDYVYAACVAIEGAVPNTTVDHIAVNGSAAAGFSAQIQLSTYGGNADNMTNLKVTNSVFLNTLQNTDDMAPIYMHDWSGLSTGIVVTNNFMRGWPGNHHATGVDGAPVRCLYFDAATENVTATKNICANPGTNADNSVSNGSPSMIGYFCGQNNIFNDNIFDLGTNSFVFILETGNCGPPPSIPAETGDQFEHNIIISNYAGALTSTAAGCGNTGYIWGVPSAYPTITTNLYYNYGGGAVGTTGSCASIGDASPITGHDPGFNTANNLYQLNSGAYALGAPLNFPAIPGGYGPSGYVIPAPSSAPVSY